MASLASGESDVRSLAGGRLFEQMKCGGLSCALIGVMPLNESCPSRRRVRCCFVTWTIDMTASQETLVISNDITVSNQAPFVLFGGINVLEDLDSTLAACARYVDVTETPGIPFVFKASFDKATGRRCIRTVESGWTRACDFETVKLRFGVPVLTDVHEIAQAKPNCGRGRRAADPRVSRASNGSCRRHRADRTGRNIKKPQFMSRRRSSTSSTSARSGQSERHAVRTRSSFGYDNLVVDMLGFRTMREASGGCPVIFDVTHSLQRRDAGSEASGGRREQVFELARAVLLPACRTLSRSHENPDQARCDGPSALPLALLEPFLVQMKAVDDLVSRLCPSRVVCCEQRLSRAIRLVLFDVDGVLTDGSIYLDGESECIKPFNVKDGVAVALLRAHGVATGIVSARSSPR